MTSAKALAELRKHGELSLVRSHWAVFTGPGDSMAVLPADVGLRLVSEGLAVAERRGRYLRLKPA